MCSDDIKTLDITQFIRTTLHIICLEVQGGSHRAKWYNMIQKTLKIHL